MGIAIKGGDALLKSLNQLGRQISRGQGVRVGFLEGATYPGGLSVAYVASIQEFGAEIDVAAHDQTIYRSLAADGSFNQDGRFVKAGKSNYATTHAVGEYTINIPPRPFFRHMIAVNSPHWGTQFGDLLRTSEYQMDKALKLMGEQMRAQLQESIRSWTTPPNAASTIAKKGFDKPLTATGHMINSVDYEVIK